MSVGISGVNVVSSSRGLLLMSEEVVSANVVGCVTVLASSTISVVVAVAVVEVSVEISGVVSVEVETVLVESTHSVKSQLTLSDSLPPRHFPSGPGSTRLVLTFCPLPQVAEQADQSLQSDHLHLEVVGSIAVAFLSPSPRQSFPSSASFSFGGHVQT